MSQFTDFVHRSLELLETTAIKSKLYFIWVFIFTVTSVNQNKKLLLACQKTVLMTSWRQRSACYCIHLEVKDTDNKYAQPAEMNIHMHCQRAAAFPSLRSERERLDVQRKERKKRMLEDIKLVPWIMSLIQSKGRLKLWWCTGPQFKWSHMQLKWTGFEPKACDEPQSTDHSWHTHTDVWHLEKRGWFSSAQTWEKLQTKRRPAEVWVKNQTASKVKKAACCLRGKMCLFAKCGWALK